MARQLNQHQDQSSRQQDSEAYVFRGFGNDEVVLGAWVVMPLKMMTVITRKALNSMASFLCVKRLLESLQL